VSVTRELGGEVLFVYALYVVMPMFISLEIMLYELSRTVSCRSDL
jgi:hypothetical protein